MTIINSTDLNEPNHSHAPKRGKKKDEVSASHPLANRGFSDASKISKIFEYQHPPCRFNHKHDHKRGSRRRHHHPNIAAAVTFNLRAASRARSHEQPFRSAPRSHPPKAARSVPRRPDCCRLNCWAAQMKTVSFLIRAAGMQVRDTFS